MHAQLLRGSTASAPEDVMGHLGASQGQDYLPASWSLAQRCAEVVEHTVVDEALDAGLVLRTHTLRPTWHLVAPDALPWLLAATTPRVHQANKHYYRQVGVDEALMAEVRRVLDASSRVTTRPATRCRRARRGRDRGDRRASGLRAHVGRDRGLGRERSTVGEAADLCAVRRAGAGGRLGAGRRARQAGRGLPRRAAVPRRSRTWPAGPR